LRVIAHNPNERSARRQSSCDAPAYEPDPARSLTSLSDRLAEDGQRAQTLTEIQAAVEIGRRLAAGNQTAYEPALAWSLRVLQWAEVEPRLRRFGTALRRGGGGPAAALRM
jgi:hypothetical protein